MIIDIEKAHSLLRHMKLIRFVEEGIAERYGKGQMRCPTHLSTGQEAAAVAVCSALNKEDLVVSTHRAHGHYLAKGGNLKAMLAEIYGKQTGCAGGRGGSMHLIDTAVGFMGSSAIVANSIPVAIGLALSLQLRKLPSIAVAFFGDGAVEEGVFYESVNFAAVRKLPVLFACENNLYSVYSPLSVRQPKERKIYEMARALGVQSGITDGNDIEEAFTYTSQVVESVREGCGPFFIELPTYRWREHCGHEYDNHIGYRSEKEFEQWKKRDPIAMYERKLIKKNFITEAEIDQLNNAVLGEVNEAFEYAQTSPFPPEDSAYTEVYATTIQ